ncbi:MAG TPA: hypothetical protein VF230_12415, partial [Acidimicrobiales bacterium]
LARASLRFLSDAQGIEGGFRNRLDRRGYWEDRPLVDDCWGRSLWALGTVAAYAEEDWMRQSAVTLFERSARRRSPWSRAMSYAALGAAELLAIAPWHREARALAGAVADAMPMGTAPGWAWPEARLSYANAVLPEAMIATGHATGRADVLDRGLELLAWLLDHESNDGHVSVTPAGGDAPGSRRPAFDQQPIEVAAIAEACARAATVDPSNRRWPAGVDAAAAWFLGENDVGCVMFDPATGGGYDGLEVTGPNLNQGAESTLAMLSTLQHHRRIVPAPA